jgi:hypothetical protein
VEPNRHQRVKLLSAVIAASAIVVMGALAVALGQERTGTSLGSGGMSRGETSTQSTAATSADPTTIETSKASPTMKAVRPRGFR